jgi:prophage regulatory protein
MQPVSPRRILRKPSVENRTGLSDTSIWRQYRAGTFPKPVKLGPNAVGWYEDEVNAWIESRERTGPKA